MTTIICVSAVILFVFVVIIGFLIYQYFKRRTAADAIKDSSKLTELTELDWKIKFLLIASVILVIFSFIAPFLSTRKAATEDFNFRETGPIADTIGGLMNPFITLAGVVVTGLAFYMQYRANFLQRQIFIQEQVNSKQDLQAQINRQNQEIEQQQFDSKFYEMLALHRENISEMKIDGYDFEEDRNGVLIKRFEKATENRKVFVLMKTELEFILYQYRKVYNELDKEGFGKCYELFFFGLDAFMRRYPAASRFSDLLVTMRKKHQFPFHNDVKLNKRRKNFGRGPGLYINYKPFSGHSSRLGHYYRHLFLTVKSVVKSKTVRKYKRRMEYLKLLRAQLSNHEQIMLFYNWLGGYGNAWENGKNNFFTEYCMIHNLWYHELMEDKFIEANVNQLKTKKVQFRQCSMFEIDES